MSEAGAETAPEGDASVSGSGEDSASDDGGVSAANQADGSNTDETAGTGADSAASAAEMDPDAPVIERICPSGMVNDRFFNTSDIQKNLRSMRLRMVR